MQDEYRRPVQVERVRGKYATRYQAGTNLVLSSPDVAEYFRDEQFVNTALRNLIHVAKALAFQPLPSGRRLGSLAPSGALGVVVADAATGTKVFRSVRTMAEYIAENRK